MEISENFSYVGPKQNFDRDSYATLADMKAVSDNDMPNVFLAVCEETGKAYVYKKTNNVDSVLGKWRDATVDESAPKLTAEQIAENAKEFISTLLKLKPASLKGTYVKSIYLSSTMSPGIKIDLKAVDEL